MKKIILTYTVICIYAATVMNNACSQTTGNFAGLQFRTAKTGTPNNKWQLTALSTRDYINAISIKVVRHFLRDFKNVKNVTWSKSNYGTYAAQFLNDSIRTTVGYNNNGSLNYTYKEYGEGSMPASIRALVKNAFLYFAIAGVKEIILPQENDIIYSVVIKDGNNFKILKITNNEIQIVAELAGQ